MTLVRRIKIFLILFVVRVFRAIEYIGLLVKNALRIGTVAVIFSFFFLAFYLESKEVSFYRYVPNVVSYRGVERNNTPVVTNNIPKPALSAKSALAVDVSSDSHLYELDIHSKYPMASTTKLMTALVSLDLYDLDDYVITPRSCTKIPGSNLGLLSGEKMKASDLLTALLVSSSNDAACVLSSAKVSLSEFILRMNTKAVLYGLKDTLFDNAIGFDSASNTNYSTAFDLYLLAKEALREDFIVDVVKLGETTLKSGVEPRKIYTTNHLLWAIPESYGIKTGKTLAAGEVLIYGYRELDKDIIIVVMGSDERFIDTRRILDWVNESYSWR